MDREQEFEQRLAEFRQIYDPDAIYVRQCGLVETEPAEPDLKDKKLWKAVLLKVLSVICFLVSVSVIAIGLAGFLGLIFLGNDGTSIALTAIFDLLFAFGGGILFLLAWVLWQRSESDES